MKVSVEPVVRKHIMADHSHFHDEPEKKKQKKEGQEEKRERKIGERRRETERREIKVPLTSLRTHPPMTYGLPARFHHHTILPEWESII